MPKSHARLAAVARLCCQDGRERSGAVRRRQGLPPLLGPRHAARGRQARQRGAGVPVGLRGTTNAHAEHARAHVTAVAPGSHRVARTMARCARGRHTMHSAAARLAARAERGRTWANVGERGRTWANVGMHGLRRFATPLTVRAVMAFWQSGKTASAPGERWKQQGGGTDTPGEARRLDARRVVWAASGEAGPMKRVAVAAVTHWGWALAHRRPTPARSHCPSSTRQSSCCQTAAGTSRTGPCPPPT